MNSPLPDFFGLDIDPQRFNWPPDSKCFWCGQGRVSMHVNFKGYECFMHAPCVREMEADEGKKSGEL